MDAIFLDVPGVTGIADDMIIYGRSDLEHEKTFDQLSGSSYRCSSDFHKVSFFGHQWSAKGLSPDPKKIAAVKRMNLPQDVETMRSFLGLVNYLNRFSPCLAELSEPVREICRQDMEFKLTESVCVAFFKDKRGNIQECDSPIFQS